jgi:polyferredoxin
MNGAQTIRTRRSIGWALLVAFVVLPFTGMFEIDVSSGRFLIAGYQIWWDDFFIVFPFWAMMFFSMTAFYSNFGMIFCGWMCPQNTLSEWLNNLIRFLLGRRLVVGISPERQGGNSKQKAGRLVLAWTVVVVVVLVASAILTLAMLRYFFPFEVLWGHFIAGEHNLYIAVFSILLGTFVVIDLGLLRHFWCKYMCPYGVWQYMFRNRDTLQIRFADARKDDCKSCSLCKDVCPMDLDPRQPEIYTRCINCAICIDACEGYMGRFDKQPMLSFGFGTKKEELIRIETKRSRVFAQSVMWPMSGVLISALMFAYGVSTFNPIKMVVHQPQTAAYETTDHRDYRLSIVNKGSQPQAFELSLEGLPESLVTMEMKRVSVAVGEAVEIALSIHHGNLSYNQSYPFRVLAKGDGEDSRFVADGVYFQPDMSVNDD